MIKQNREKLEHLRSEILSQMQLLIPKNTDFPQEFYDMIYYHLGWENHTSIPIVGSSGKMMRAIFGLLCCEMVDGDMKKTTLGLAAIELIHNFSLIHDDIQDDSLMRRGRKTVWAIWGKAQAINAGDALFTIGRNSLLKLSDKVDYKIDHQVDHKIDHQVVLKCIELMDEACLALCKGQYLDISFEKKTNIDIDNYLQMVRLKTSTLWGLAGYFGAYISTKDEEVALICQKIGENIGISFQIQDDISSIWGLDQVTGKTGNDLQKCKKNLPLIHALNLNKNQRKSEILQIYQQQKISEQDVIELRKILDQTKSKQFSMDTADKYIKKAINDLSLVGQSSSCKDLIYSLGRVAI